MVVHIYRDGLAYEVEFTTLGGDRQQWLLWKVASASGSQAGNHARAGDGDGVGRLVSPFPLSRWEVEGSHGAQHEGAKYDGACGPGGRGALPAVGRPRA